MPSPVASTIRSPTLSVRNPHGSRVTSVPSQWLESTAPTWARLKSNVSLIAGAIAGMPMPIAAKLLWANVPVASTVQRYGERATAGRG